jgi:hypothetical protein
LGPLTLLLSITSLWRPGRITFKNLKRVAKELGENLTDEEIQEMSEWQGLRVQGRLFAAASLLCMPASLTVHHPKLGWHHQRN